MFQLDPDDPDQAEIIARNERTDARVQALLRQGVQMQFDVSDLLLEHVLGVGEARVAYERDVSLAREQLMDDAESQIARARLTQGVISHHGNNGPAPGA